MEAVNSGLPGGSFEVAVTALAIDPQNPGTLYVGALVWRDILYASHSLAIQERRWSAHMELNLAEVSQLAGPHCVTISALAIDPQNNGAV